MIKTISLKYPTVGHLGYIIENGLGVDFRYEMANPEFDMNTESLLQSFDSYGFGISKYLDGNNLKMQLGAYKADFDSGIIATKTPSAPFLKNTFSFHHLNIFGSFVFK